MAKTKKDERFCSFYSNEEIFNSNVINNELLDCVRLEFKHLPIVGEIIQLTLWNADDYYEINNYDDFAIEKYKVIEFNKRIITDKGDVEYRYLVEKINIKLTRKVLTEKK